MNAVGEEAMKDILVIAYSHKLIIKGGATKSGHQAKGDKYD